MTLALSLSSAAGRTGRGVRVAMVDSGVHARHPHVGAIAGGAAIGDDGPTGGDLVDRLGHGTAVAAAIREKAPDAELLAVKIFDHTLSTTGETLAEAIAWAATKRASLINLSLGTANQDHRPRLEGAIAAAAATGAIVVAAAPEPGVNWLPGALAGVVGVTLDWSCARDACRVETREDGAVSIAASGFPRPIPGVPPAANLKGLSFAVANATGLLACAIEGQRVRSISELVTAIGALVTGAPPR